jgi:Zn ribbon nucleic-acid-binding protein
MEVRLGTEAESNNLTAQATGVPRRTVDRIVQRVVERAQVAGEEGVVHTPNILIVDIETAPMMAYLWSLWQNGTNIQAVDSRTYILSWAAKWLGNDEVYVSSLYDSPEYEPGMEQSSSMMEELWRLMDDADFIVAHNGDRFDIKRINSEFLLLDLPPPSPYKTIDTLKIAKRAFGFDSNKLEYLLPTLVGTEKGSSGGMETWIGCLKGQPEAWEKMIKYNVQDVVELERLYLKIRGWDKLHPSMATWGGNVDVPTCTACGSEDVFETDKTVATGSSVFRVWRCMDCGHNMRSRNTLLTKEQRNNVLMNTTQ